MLTDKNMDKLLFVKGNVYRATGTTSQHVVDEKYSSSVSNERIKSMESLNSLQMVAKMV